MMSELTSYMQLSDHFSLDLILMEFKKVHFLKGETVITNILKVLYEGVPKYIDYIQRGKMVITY